MTLGGLALAVGILVDDATVAIENIHRNIGQRKPFVRAIIDGAQQIAVPAFVSTLCICIVFVPIAFLTGAARSLFVPLALAVVFAMLMSYLLSRTLVPTMVHYLLAPRGDVARHRAEPRSSAAFDRGVRAAARRLRPLARVGARSTARSWSVGVRRCSSPARSRCCRCVGRDFFPTRRRRA